MKLVMLRQPILVDITAEINPKDFYVNFGYIFQADSVFNEGNNPNKSNPIVTDHNYKIIAGIEGLPKLDLSSIAEEIGWVDVEKLVYQSAQKIITDRNGNPDKTLVNFGLDCIEKFQSLNDKKYSEEQIMQAISMARDINDGKDYFTAEDISGCTEVCTYGWKNRYFDSDIIQSLQQPKEYNVEYIQEGNTIKVTKIVSKS